MPHTLGIIETSTGGCISSAITSIPGISRHFLESSVLYNQESKERLLRGRLDGESSVSPQTAFRLAKAFRKQSNADFVLAETGMAGPPDASRHSTKNGQCCLALVSEAEELERVLALSPFFTKNQHQLLFALEAVKWLIETLAIADRREGSL